MQDTHIKALSKNKNLTDLELASEFDVNAQDTVKDHAYFVRCYKRRLKTTQDLASVCPRLQRCRWVQMSAGDDEMFHSFIVEERMTDGNVTRVVRGIKQDWMGRNHEAHSGSIVNCKLEDLPGDIIGQNDVE